MLAALALVLGCSSDPPGTAQAHGGNTATTGGAGSLGGAGQVTGGVGGVPGVAGDAPNIDEQIAPPFKPMPPVAVASRWSETIVAEYSENYTFRITANAPVRALLAPAGDMAAAEQILRDWTAQGSRVAVGSVWLAAGASYQLVVEADAAVPEPGLVVEWESPSKRRSVVPKSMAADAGLTKQSLYEVERSNFNRDTYDRAIESLDAVNFEIQGLVHQAWGRS